VTSIIDLLELSKRTAIKAYEALYQESRCLKKGYFSKLSKCELKTDADLLLDDVIKSNLQKTGIDILSEESGNVSFGKNSKLRFIIDPIDGSMNFARGIEHCSISIALWNDSEPVFGVIKKLSDNTIAWGGKEIGSYIDDINIKVSGTKSKKHSILSTGLPGAFDITIADNQKILIDKMLAFGKVRMFGSASISLLKLAVGEVDAYYEKDIKIWDVAAGIPIVLGAGGRVIFSDVSLDNTLDIYATNNLI